MNNARRRKLSLRFAQVLTQPSMNSPHAFHLPLGGETLVKPFGAKFAHEVAPRLHHAGEGFSRSLIVPLLNQLAVLYQIAQNAKERFKGYVSSKHEFLVISPYGVHDLA